ncbi:hypothetical protein F4827_005687 [Paraburkholderia bannensis]|uniref:Uncharacterized protein n=2 Tax=Paraburkholderia TaxID=1822464 RepID=A0A7W9U2I8_9BURK|nr:hypothetical protein [Paraburkholderia bannensis]MBB6105817.1 hypothetical protein [Paraburkholderia bannensis]
MDTKVSYMRKMRIHAVMLWIAIGTMKTISPIPVHAEPSMAIPSGRSEKVAMDSHISNEQRKTFYAMLDQVMEIFRDNKSFSKNESAFGVMAKMESSFDDSGRQYLYKCESIPSASIEFITVSDPLNFSDDRSQVPVVPQSFRIMFRHLVYGLDRAELERRLSLESYWVDSNGVKHDGNSLQSFPPSLQLHVYRYRAKQLVGSRFPVDVELSFFDPRSEDINKEPILNAITVVRSYPYLTPEMRKKKREEEQQKMRD